MLLVMPHVTRHVTCYSSCYSFKTGIRIIPKESGHAFFESAKIVLKVVYLLKLLVKGQFSPL